MSSSPRPIAHRAFTVLLAFLLVGSIFAPIGAAEPAAAQTESDGCLYDSVNWWVFSCAPQSSTEYVDTEQTAKETKVDLHVQGQGIWEDWVSLETDVSNYLEDSETIASLEAKHAMATAYENNKTASEADTDAQEAIQDYYATRQVKMAEDWSRQQAQLSYIGNVSENISEISDTYAGRVLQDVDAADIGQTPRPAGGTRTVNSTLINGSTYEYDAANIEFAVSYSGNDYWYGYNPRIDQMENGSIYVPEGASNTYDVTDRDGGGSIAYEGVTLGSQTWIDRAYNDAPPSLQSQMIFDEARWYDQWVAIEEQAATMQENYPDGFASDVYAKLDSGELTTDELRSAEGMARYLSGDSNVTSDRFQQANIALMGLDRPMDGNTSTMVVKYDGATEMTINASDENATREPTNYVNGTYEGLLYANAPDRGFETGTEYSTSELNGTPTFYTNDGETVRFYDGDFTITEMYDTDGNLVDSTNWDEPNYDTYDADAFVQAIENASKERTVIVSERDDGDGGDTTISIDNPFGDIGAGGAIVGLVIIVAAVGVVAAVVVRRP